MPEWSPTRRFWLSVIQARWARPTTSPVTAGSPSASFWTCWPTRWERLASPGITPSGMPFTEGFRSSCASGCCARRNRRGSPATEPGCWAVTSNTALRRPAPGWAGLRRLLIMRPSSGACAGSWTMNQRGCLMTRCRLWSGSARCSGVLERNWHRLVLPGGRVGRLPRGRSRLRWPGEHQGPD